MAVLVNAGLTYVADRLATAKWLALYTAGPDTAGVGTEATGYTRLEIATWTYTMVYPRLVISNTDEIVLDPSINATITGWVLLTASTGGTKVGAALLTTPLVSTTDNRLVIPPNTISYSITST